MNRAIQIILVQCGVALVLLPILWNVRPFQKAPKEQMEHLSHESLLSLSKSVQHYEQTKQFRKKDEEGMREKIQHLLAALECEQKGFQLYPRLAVDGVIPIDVRMDIGIEREQIPTFLSGIQRFPYNGVLEKLEYSTRTNSLFMQLRFLRASPTPPSWIEKSVELSPKEKSIATQGFMLMFWKSFHQKQMQRQENNPLLNAQFFLQVSRRLNQEKDIFWSREEGFTDKSF